MADTNEVHIGENSPEYVAYRLYKDIQAGAGEEEEVWAKEWILSTYAECLETVKNPYKRTK